ncbi:response regulator [Planctobacterium marinum]|uniref:Response regulatory domain-containing protein n=1 Tax=Planctobacterium marinum TaxID=1631968 RepID=A0AA48KSG0_9ALTE|nr:hypothetical protein MACH26_26180 [Planctobacterium marinum]
MVDKALAAKSKVLVIDDQELAIGYIKYPLEKLGFHDITIADRVQTAMDLINTRIYDLIVCAYEFRKEKDGYFLYDDLKRRNMLSLLTTFVFVSADTSKELIHSILELQPDDFIAKPFTIKDLDKRLTRALSRKRALRTIYRYMQNKKYNSALESVNEFLADTAHADYFPTALKTKGEILLAMDDAQTAIDFHQAIVDVQPYSWAQMGLVKALLKANDVDEAEKLILRLALKPDSQLLAYDMLTELQIHQQDFDMALESSVVASEVSPRNLHRHQQTADLSRLTNDHKTLFETSKKIIKYAKNSMHDKPEIYLNVARAGIDYAMTTEEEETINLTQEANDYLTHFAEIAQGGEVQTQIDVCNARILQLQNDESGAKELLQQIHDENWQSHSEYDLLDRAKALHAVGMHKESAEIITHIANKAAQQDGAKSVHAQYLMKEKQQKEDILLTPKELNNKAVGFYQRGDTANAMDVFGKAFSLMPKNTSIALNLLQTLSMKAQSSNLAKSDKAMMKKCIYTIENGELSNEQKERYLKVKSYLSDMS